MQSERVGVTALSADYSEARRQARAMLGEHSDVEFRKGSLFPARVGVWARGERGMTKFIYVGLGSTFEEALNDAKHRQVEDEEE